MGKTGDGRRVRGRGGWRGLVTAAVVASLVGGTAVLAVPVSAAAVEGALPQAEVGRWHFDDAVAGSGVTVAKDTASVGPRHDATLHTAGAGWSTMARRGEADQSLWLDSANPANQRAYASTDEAAVNTADSVTFSTWVYLTDVSSSRMVMTTPGSQAQAFALYYSSSSKGWVFSHTVADSATPVIITSNAEAANPPLRVWTHLTGVFDTHADTDAANDTLQLYVNGRPQGAAVKLAAAATARGAIYKPWNAREGLQFGRSLIRGQGGLFFRGRIDESAVWQRALTDDEVLQEARLERDGVPANELVAQWDATSATGTTIGELSPYPHPAMRLSATGAVLDSDDQALTLDGVSGYASVEGPVVDESGSFTVSARVKPAGRELATKPNGYRAQVAGQRSGGQSSWALWILKRTDDIYQWQFTRTATDSLGKVTHETAVTPASDLAELDTWVDVTGVFDAQAPFEAIDPEDPSQTREGLGTLRLYVGSFSMDSTSSPGFDAVQQGSGELAAGRGAQGGTTGHYLPGSLRQLRIWTGAMNENHIWHQVLDPTADDATTLSQ
ncbi:LamG domain-containing protein [Streptomyces niveus]|uniref:LamG domain-containing protein n=1 Tax=Streptomyces niveus TaxID=193462 RepID=UPI003656A729